MTPDRTVSGHAAEEGPRAEPNPLRVGLETEARLDPCLAVIFGASGDLTRRKLIPAVIV